MWKDQTIVQLIFFLCQTVVTATLPRNNGCCPSKVKNVAAVLLHQVFQALPTTTVLLLKWICNCGTVAPDKYLYDVVTQNLTFQGFNSLPGWPSPWRWCRWGEWCKRRGRPCVNHSVLKEFLTNIVTNVAVHPTANNTCPFGTNVAAENNDGKGVLQLDAGVPVPRPHLQPPPGSVGLCP